MFRIPVSKPDDLSSVIESLTGCLGPDVESTLLDLYKKLENEGKAKQPQSHSKIQPQEKKTQGPINFNNILQNIMDGSEQKCSSQNRDYEITEHNGHIYVNIDLPGVDKSSITISFENNTLSISSDRKPSDVCGNVLKSTIKYGCNTMNITIKQKINADDIKASYNNGILHISIPKHAECSKRVFKVD